MNPISLCCRICDVQLGQAKLVLPRMPLTDDFISTKKINRQEYLADISIYQCDACGLVQNPVNFDHEAYYRDYAYTSGHSVFVKKFMADYALSLLAIYNKINGRDATSVIEAGSGDGEQLWQFKQLGISDVCGVEPSITLTKNANDRSIHTELGFFDSQYVNKQSNRYDICLSSYTFDHVRDPRDYLRTAQNLLTQGGLLAFEVHDLDVISQRSEFCLFEHEHTIYLNRLQAIKLLRDCGFEIVAINPLAADVVRGNSMIVVAQKMQTTAQTSSSPNRHLPADLLGVQFRIQSLIHRLDTWVAALPPEQRLVGFGVGGRGVMTLAALSQSQRFVAMFDSNYQSGQLLTPKTRVPVVGSEEWCTYCDANCIVFSFGYFQEIRQQLLEAGFAAERIVSLADFFEDELIA